MKIEEACDKALRVAEVYFQEMGIEILDSNCQSYSDGSYIINVYVSERFYFSYDCSYDVFDEHLFLTSSTWSLVDRVTLNRKVEIFSIVGKNSSIENEVYFYTDTLVELFKLYKTMIISHA